MPFDPRLAAELMFDEIDLEWNRRGMLSPSQEQGILGAVAAERGSRPARLTIVLVSLVVAGVLAVVGTRQSKSSTTVLAVVLVILGVAGLLVGTLIVFGGRRRATITGSRMAVISGEARLQRKTSSGESGLETWLLHLGAVAFKLDWLASQAIQEGRLYQAFYLDGTPAGRQLLSIEPL